MSSPLTLLGKNRRAPLPGSLDEGGRKIGPFEKSSLAERELLRDIVTRRCRPGLDGGYLSNVSQRDTATDCTTPTDFELMSTMMQKLAQLEVKTKAQALDIQRKEKTIAMLKEKLKLPKNSEARNCEEELVQKCHRLQNQVWEMEEFLADYGMIWVGNSDDRETSGLMNRATVNDAGKHPGQKPATSGTGQFRMNFDLLLANVRELNVLAGEGESYVKAVPGGAQLARQTPIPLQLYSNGIVMFSGPFRSYDEPSTQQCMQDLMDGYFPSELQDRFPDGVPFQVEDRRGEEYRDPRRREDFPGKGQVVCGAANEKSAQSPASSAHTNSHVSGKMASTEQFLRQLPKTVIKAGKVIDIRDSIRKHLQGPTVEAQHPSLVIIDTPALHTLQERLDQSDSNACESDGEFSTLRVKSEDGEKTFILKMRATQTVGDLRQYLDKHRRSGSAAFSIISLFPRRCYDDDTETLAACGLTPSAALLLQPC